MYAPVRIGRAQTCQKTALLRHLRITFAPAASRLKLGTAGRGFSEEFLPQDALFFPSQRGPVLDERVFAILSLHALDDRVAAGAGAFPINLAVRGWRRAKLCHLLSPAAHRPQSFALRQPGILAKILRDAGVKPAEFLAWLP